MIPSVQSGKYELSVEAAGFNSLSRTIEIDSDQDLGRIVMDADPNVMRGSSLCCGSILISTQTENQATPVPVGTPPLVVRGQIENSSLVTGKRLTVQLSCSEQPPGMPQRPQTEVDRVSIDTGGFFEAAVPACSDDMLAHRELRFSLKDEDGATVALLVPKMTLEGYYQSKIGIWLPLKPLDEQRPVHEAAFFPEFTDNRPLQAKISVSPYKDRYVAGEDVFLSATLTNTSEEVLAIPSTAFESDFAWIITDDHGKRVPFHLFLDRTGEPSESRQPTRILFPGESETYVVNIGLAFTLNSPGTYQVLARRTVRRFEISGEEQITSSQSAFVIDPLTPCQLVKHLERYQRKMVQIRTAIRSSDTDTSGLLFDRSCPEQIHLETPNDPSLLMDSLYRLLQDSLMKHRVVDATVSGKFEIVLAPSGGQLLTFTLQRVLSVNAKNHQP